MELFGKNYLHVRNTYLIPRLNYGIKRDKLSYWSLKSVLTDKLVSLRKLNKNRIEVEITKDDYFKAIHCEIELFMNKSVIQYADFINQRRTSKTWSFVTFYYFSFFTATCLFRFLDRGFLFFSTNQITRFNQYSLAVNSEIIQLSSGNYYFSVTGVSDYGNLIITISEQKDTVHKSTWTELETVLSEFKNNSDDSEKVFFQSLLQHFSSSGFGSAFPSHLRNKLNYNGDSSILDINDDLPIVELQKIDSLFIKRVTLVNTGEITGQIDSVSFISSYFFEFNQKLYKEYLSRSSFGQDFNLERKNYLKRIKVNLQGIK